MSGTAEQGYLHCGPSGAGHFVKMVHNGIEYGIMAAYAEGLGVLSGSNIGKHAGGIDAETTPLRDPEHYQYDLNLRDISEVWRRGSVISSWLLDLTAGALAKDATLSDFAGRVSDSGEEGGRSKPPLTKACLCVSSPRRCTSDSPPAARETSRINCYRRCVSSSADT
jgi:6-phosphogluconate dehydrogenase